MGDGARRKEARFVFISDGSARVATAEADHPTTRIGWRVMAANNRALGRSAAVYSNLVECRSAALNVRRRVDEVIGLPSLDISHGLWKWAAQLDSADVAVCVHPFLRRVDCLRALRLFLAAVRKSDPNSAELRYFGPLSLRAYDRDVEVTL